MPVATPETFRFANTITIDGPNDQQFVCKRPDPMAMLAAGVLPLPTFADLIERAAAGQMTTDDLRNDPATYADFVNRWVCAAVVQPTVVLTVKDESTELDVEELSVDLRLEIFRRTNDRLVSRRVIDAVAEFRRQQLPDPGSGSSGAAVPDASFGSLGADADIGELVVRA